ncbi:MAG: thioesterase [Bacteroidetes bacterium]|nr:MAG: thioesterase [Bacteroidota bacterium]
MEFTPIDLTKLNSINKGTMMEVLGIEYLEARQGYLKAKMPVDERTFQPARLLHGGASMALAETLGSVGSSIMVNLDEYEVRGSQLSANHIKSAKKGWVIGEAILLHRGSNTHVWNIDIKNESGKLISTCRLTNFIIKKRPRP